MVYWENFEPLKWTSNPLVMGSFLTAFVAATRFLNFAVSLVAYYTMVIGVILAANYLEYDSLHGGAVIDDTVELKALCNSTLGGLMAAVCGHALGVVVERFLREGGPDLAGENHETDDRPLLFSDIIAIGSRASEADHASHKYLMRSLGAILSVWVPGVVSVAFKWEMRIVAVPLLAVGFLGTFYHERLRASLVRAAVALGTLAVMTVWYSAYGALLVAAIAVPAFSVAARLRERKVVEERAVEMATAP